MEIPTITPPLHDISIVGPFVHKIFELLNGGLPIQKNFDLTRIDEIFGILSSFKIISSKIEYKELIKDFEMMTNDTFPALRRHYPMIILEIVQKIIWIFVSIQNAGTTNQIKGNSPVYRDMRLWIRNAIIVKTKWNEIIAQFGEGGYVGSSFKEGIEKKIYYPCYSHLFIPDMNIPL